MKTLKNIIGSIVLICTVLCWVLVIIIAETYYNTPHFIAIVVLTFLLSAVSYAICKDPDFRAFLDNIAGKMGEDE